MESSEQTRERLKGILDRLGPDLWLAVRDGVLEHAFGREATHAAAEDFAHENHCAFRYEAGGNGEDGTAFFGRAYGKKLTDIA